MRRIMGAVLVVLFAAGCSAASEARSARPTRTDPPTTTTTVVVTMPPPTTAPRPIDPDGLRCQAVVDQRVTELAAAVPYGVDVVCRHRDADPKLAGKAGYFAGGLAVIAYPLAGGPARELAVWRDTVAHELGHAWWHAHIFNFSNIDLYRAIRGAALVEPVYEDYADVFAHIVGGSQPPLLSYIKTPPPHEQVEAICAAGLVPC